MKQAFSSIRQSNCIGRFRSYGYVRQCIGLPYFSQTCQTAVLSYYNGAIAQSSHLMVGRQPLSFLRSLCTSLLHCIKITQFRWCIQKGEEVYVLIEKVDYIVRCYNGSRCFIFRINGFSACRAICDLGCNPSHSFRVGFSG